MYHCFGLGQLPTAEQERAAIEAAYAGGYGDMSYLMTPEQLAASLYRDPRAASIAAGLPIASTLTEWLKANAGYLALGVGAFVILLFVGRR